MDPVHRLTRLLAKLDGLNKHSEARAVKWAFNASTPWERLEILADLEYLDRDNESNARLNVVRELFVNGKVTTELDDIECGFPSDAMRSLFTFVKHVEPTVCDKAWEWAI